MNIVPLSDLEPRLHYGYTVYILYIEILNAAAAGHRFPRMTLTVENNV